MHGNPIERRKAPEFDSGAFRTSFVCVEARVSRRESASVLGLRSVRVPAVAATTGSHQGHLRPGSRGSAFRERGTPAWSGDGTLSVVYGPGKADPVGFGAVSPVSRARDQELAAAFGKRLRALRLERRLTQEQLAEAAAVHPTYISNVERGYSAPTLYTLLRLAEALEVLPGQLVDGLRP
jgi:DNA-binding XRE family transcriptional regulator